LCHYHPATQIDWSELVEERAGGLILAREVLLKINVYSNNKYIFQK
jgi:hypothetical protein